MDKRELSCGFVNASSILSKVLQTLGMSVTEFSNACKVSYTRISDVVRGRTKKLTPELINLICDAFPQINKTYLYTGDGDVLIEGYVSKTELESSKNVTINKNVNDLLKLQQELINKQTAIINKLEELSKREIEVSRREVIVKQRELAVMEKEAALEMGKSA